MGILEYFDRRSRRKKLIKIIADLKMHQHSYRVIMGDCEWQDKILCLEEIRRLNKEVAEYTKKLNELL